MNAHNLPRASNDTSPRSMCPQAVAGSTDTATLYLDDAMLDDTLPIIRRRLSETRHVDLDPRVHWTTYPLTIAGVCVALIFVGQLARGFLAGAF